jgi:hypothetical protein
MKLWPGILALCLALPALAPAPASAECRLALALGLDVSSSVDAREYALQAEGLAEALEDPDVRAAILTPATPVALAIFEWSGDHLPTDVLGWTLLTSAGALDAVVARIRATPRSHSDLPTALGRALGYGATILRRGPKCLRKTLDVSGDGENNHGFPPGAAYRAFDFSGVTVNGLVVGGALRPDLVAYYRANVLHGPEAFVEIADDYRDYARTMRRKLLREVSEDLVVGELR